MKYRNDYRLHINRDRVVHPRGGVYIRCILGHLWITWRNGETVLHPGETFTVGNHRKCRISSFSDAEAGISGRLPSIY